MIDFMLLILILVIFFIPLIIISLSWWGWKYPIVDLTPYCKKCNFPMEPTSQIKKSGDTIGMGVTASGDMVPVLGLGSDLNIILCQCPKCNRVVMLDKLKLRKRIKREQIERFGSEWRIDV